MAWPAPIARLFATLSATWTDAKPEVDGEIDQLVDQTNAILAEGQTQELRITDVSARVDSMTTLYEPVGLKLSVGTDINSDVRVQADAIAMNDGDTIIASVDIVGDFYDDPAMGNGGLDTGGAPPVDTWLFVWVFCKPGTSGNDPVVIFSESRTAPATGQLPSGYTVRALVGVILALDDAGSAKLMPFIHDNDFYLFMPNDTTTGMWGDIGVLNGSVGYDVDFAGMTPPLFPQGCNLALMGLDLYLTGARPLFSPGPASVLYLSFSNVMQFPEMSDGGTVRDGTCHKVPLDENQAAYLRNIGAGVMRTDHFWPIGFWWRP